MVILKKFIYPSGRFKYILYPTRCQIVESWSGVPETAQSLALICDDPDAPGGTWVHWVLFNIPADTDGLSSGIPPDATLENGARHGTNDFRRLGYGGPCPPGGTHRFS